MQQVYTIKTAAPLPKTSPHNLQSKIVPNNSSKSQSNTQDKRVQRPQELQVSVLPLQSYRRNTPSRAKKIISQVKFLHLNKSKSPSSASHSRIRAAKNVFFRAKTHFVSEEKQRNKFEETLMFERERRFHKQDIQKKNQRLVSPHLIKDQQLKKFARTQEKRLLAQKKKFKRIKEKPNEHDLAVREKLMKKFIEDPRNQLSGIAEMSQGPNLSHMQMVTKIPTIAQTFSEVESQTLQQQQNNK